MKIRIEQAPEGHRVVLTTERGVVVSLPVDLVSEERHGTRTAVEVDVPALKSVTCETGELLSVTGGE